MRRIGLLLAGVPLLAALFVGEPLSASAGSYWEGTKSAAPFSRERACPVEIESAEILFSIPEFPRPEEGSGACGASVTASYTFCNPTAEDKTARVLFPAGGFCGYAPISGESGYTVTDGAGTPLNCRLRYTYLGNGFAGAAVAEERREDEFFGEDTSALHVSYSYSRPKEAERTYFRLALTYNPAKTRIAFDGSPKVTIEDGRVNAVWQTAEESGGFGYYSFGEPAAAEELAVSRDRTRTVGDTEGMEVNVSEETAPLGEFLEARRPASIGASDWYNGFVDAMNFKQSLGFAFLSFDKFNETSFTPWCEYDLSVPAEGRAENVVTSPLYPGVATTGDAKSTAYRYEYLLSPAQSWSDFRTLKVEIRTPFYIKESSLTFEKTDMGYAFQRAGLPLGELSFTLTETENAADSITPFRVPSTLYLVVVVLAASAAILVAVVIAVAVHYAGVRKRMRKQAERGAAREGKLPPE